MVEEGTGGAKDTDEAGQLDYDDKPPLFEWNTMWRGTIFGLILVILAIAGLYVESAKSVLYGKGDFSDIAGRLASLKAPFKWG